MPTKVVSRQAGAGKRLLCALCALALLLSGCGGGSASTGGTGNPWAGTYSSQFVLKGDAPDSFTGPDGTDTLMQAQIRQILKNRTYELGIYAVSNRTGYVQQLTVNATPMLSYLYQGTPVFQIPGAVTLLGDGLARFDLQLAEPKFDWQTLALRGVFDSKQVNDLVARLYPNRFQNIVAGDPVNVSWEITGMLGNRLVQTQCIQRMWLYAEPSSVH